MHFEFNQQLMPQNVIEVEEVGEFALEGWNDLGYYWYLVIRTIMGTSVIATCGPIIPDIGILPDGFAMSLSKTPFKEDKLGKTIHYFLNDHKKGLTEARIVDLDTALSQFRDLKDYMRTLSEETF